jgi:hypothetical protein
MVEWSIAPDLKSGGPKGSVGSNPTLSEINNGRVVEWSITAVY